jgi:uncharacterized membrane protein YedE/YeeE
MNRILSALAAGLVFGLGIALSGMGNPAKVLNFFDVFGTWDPSLAFVMGGALVTTAIGYRLIFGKAKAPLFDAAFQVPTSRTIDARLVGGSALFGAGWGIAGFCPGGAIPALGFAPWPTALFLISMMGGMVLARGLQAVPRRQTA